MHSFKDLIAKFCVSSSLLLRLLEELEIEKESQVYRIAQESTGICHRYCKKDSNILTHTNLPISHLNTTYTNESRIMYLESSQEVKCPALPNSRKKLQIVALLNRCGDIYLATTYESIWPNPSI